MRTHDTVSRLAKVTTILGGKKTEAIDSVLTQEYSAHSYELLSDNTPIPRFFNESIVKRLNDTDLFVFLNDMCYYSSPYVIDDMWHKLSKENTNITALYGDTLKVENEYTIRQYLPAFNATAFVSGKIGLNCGFAVAKTVMTHFRFDERLEHLYFFDLFRKLANKNMIYHLAQPIFNVHHTTIDASKDLEIIKIGQ